MPQCHTVKLYGALNLKCINKGHHVFVCRVSFEGVMLSALPREARLTFTLVGVKVINSGSEGGQKVNAPLGWVALQVFNHKL